MKHFELTYKAFGDKAILIEWPQRIDDDILDDVARLHDALASSLKKSEAIVDVIPAYSSITIIHRHPITHLSRRIEILKKIYTQSSQYVTEKRYLYSVPVCYDPALAPDLNQYLKTQNLSLDELIRLHTSQDYRVCFYGFIPGFMYLSGLVAELHCPRKSTPVLNVAKGSVAIGGEQTGIYPQTSPGGWHVIGMSPVEFLGDQSGSLGIVQAGDHICFQAISPHEYDEIKEAIAEGSYSINREVFDA